MTRIPMPALAAAFALALTLPAAPARAASNDGNVEWAGLSHVAWQDRRPLAPVLKESFQVRMQCWKDDLTAVRVYWTDGASTSWIVASRTATRGPYDVWTAQMPASVNNNPNYWFELTDGADTDYLSRTGVSDGTPVDGGFVMDFQYFSHAPYGATPVTGGVVFRVWAAGAASGFVRGDFNGWGTTAMQKVGESFSVYVAGAAAGQQYKYYFNGITWNTDARARRYNPGSSYNAYIENPFAYVWKDGAYVTPAFERMVVYQLHVGTFAGRNDPMGVATYPSRYIDVAARVGHLDSLNVTAVMFNPFTEFPGDESAGYNPVTMWAPESKYGTPDQLRAMVDSLHAHGIAVLLDIVWNHVSPTDNHLWNYDGSQIYFDTPVVDTDWGSQADFDRVGVQDYYLDSALMWLEEFHLDGYRMDATAYMTSPGQGAAGWSLMQRLNDAVDRRWADKLVVAEQLPSDVAVTKPTSLGGAGFDAQYHMTWRDNIRGAINAAAFGDPSMNNVRLALLGTAPYLTGRSAFNYVELHDEAWPSNGGQRFIKNIDTTAPYDDVWAKGRSKLAFGLTLVAPGIPAILMGTEWLEDTDFDPSSTHRLDWSKKTTYYGIFAFYRDLIDLRTRLTPLRADASIYVSHVNEGGNVIAFRRYDGGGNSMMVIANFSNTDFASYRVGVPQAGGWLEAVNSQSTRYLGSGLDNPGLRTTEAVSADGWSQSLVLQVPAMGLLVLAPSSMLDVAPGAPATPSLRFGRVTPTPARDGAAVAFALPHAGHARLALVDVTGRAVVTLADGPFAAGEHTLRWDGRDARGLRVGAGVYFLALESEGQRVVKRVPVVR